MKKIIFLQFFFWTGFSLFSQGLGDELSDFIKNSDKVTVHKVKEGNELYIVKDFSTGGEFISMVYYFSNYECVMIKIFTSSDEYFEKTLNKLIDGAQKISDDLWKLNDVIIRKEIRENKNVMVYIIEIYRKDIFERILGIDKEISQEKLIKSIKK